MSDDVTIGRGCSPIPDYRKHNPDGFFKPGTYDRLTKMIDHEAYDREYFEDGLANGKSLYNGFQWMPERSLKEAVSIIDHMYVKRGAKVLDWGCAKGFLVKAFRILGREAYGCDISRYAVCTSDVSVREFLRLCSFGHPFPADLHFDIVIAKDVFEHMDEQQVARALIDISHCSDKLFVAVPLGDGEKYIVPEYNYDSTHKIAQTLKWWEKIICTETEMKLLFANTCMPGMKDNWRHYPEGNGFLGFSQ